MIINKLIIKNYKSYEDENIFDFGNPSEGKNIVLIGGNNGAGKTSFLECINIAFYGFLLGKNKIEDIINKKHKQSNEDYGFTIGIVFTLDSGDSYYLRRSYKKSNNFIEKTYIEKNGQLVNSNHVNLSEFLMNQIPKDISEFFFFEGEKIQEFANDSSPNILKDSIEKVLGLKIYSTLEGDLDKIWKELYQENSKNKSNTNILSEVENKIVMSESHIQGLENKLNEIIEEIAYYNGESIKIKKYIKSVYGHEKINNGGNSLVNLELEIQKKKDRKEYLDGEIEEYIGKLGSLILSKHFDDLRKVIKDSRSYRHKSSLRKGSDQLIDLIINKLYKPKEFLSGLVWDESNYYKLKEELFLCINPDQQNYIDENVIDLSEKEEDQLLGIINRLTNEYNGELESYIEEIKDIDFEIKEINNKIQEINSNINSEDFTKNQEELSNCETKLGQYINQRDVTERNLGALRDQNKILKRQLEEIKKEQEKQHLNIEKLTKVRKFKEHIQEFISKITDSKLGELQINIKRIYNQMSYEKKIEDLKINKHSFKIDLFEKGFFHDSNNIPISKSDLSEGEKEIFALSLIYGLAKTSSLQLPLIIDAPFSKPDEIHGKNIVAKFLPYASKQVIVLSMFKDIRPNGEYYNIMKEHILKEFTIYKSDRQTAIKEGFSNTSY